MRAVALIVSLAVATGACFPNDPQRQTYAKLTEGGLVLAGVAMLFVVNTGADCDTMAKPGMPQDSCHTRATVLGDIGLGMILTGLIGFIATVSTSDDDKPSTPTIEKKPAADKPAESSPPPAPAPATPATPPPQG